MPLLITESADEFNQIWVALHQELKPCGILEQISLRDIAHHTWDIVRLRRCKVIIVNSAFRAALERILKNLLRQSGQNEYDQRLREEADDLAL